MKPAITYEIIEVSLLAGKIMLQGGAETYRVVFLQHMEYPLHTAMQHLQHSFSQWRERIRQS